MRTENELEREIVAHLSLLEDQFLDQGMSAEDARRAARRTYGGVEQAKQLHRNAAIAKEEISTVLKRRGASLAEIACSIVCIW